MAFDPDKCNVLSITRNKTPIKYSYTLHGHQLEHADKANYLGVTIQSNLTWDSYINSISTKANKTLGFPHRNINISQRTGIQISSSIFTWICLFCMGSIHQDLAWTSSYPKNRHSYYHLDYPGTCTHFHTKYLKHAYNSDSNHSFRELYETGTISPWTLWRVTLFSHSNQLSHSLITSSSKLLYI